MANWDKWGSKSVYKRANPARALGANRVVNVAVRRLHGWGRLAFHGCRGGLGEHDVELERVAAEALTFDLDWHATDPEDPRDGLEHLSHLLAKRRVLGHEVGRSSQAGLLDCPHDLGIHSLTLDVTLIDVDDERERVAHFFHFQPLPVVTWFG